MTTLKAQNLIVLNSWVTKTGIVAESVSETLAGTKLTDPHAAHARFPTSEFLTSNCTKKAYNLRTIISRSTLEDHVYAISNLICTLEHLEDQSFIFMLNSIKSKWLQIVLEMLNAAKKLG